MYTIYVAWWTRVCLAENSLWRVSPRPLSTGTLRGKLIARTPTLAQASTRPSMRASMNALLQNYTRPPGHTVERLFQGA